nr:uncharacterized protein LOC123758401 isoform X4 [Procambarus clarkii]
MCLGENMPSDDTLPCPTGTSFDATATPPDCTGTVPCDPPCRLPPCDLTCDSNLDPISDPRSCNSYYICSEEIVIGPLECPSDKPFFDGEACGVDDTKCCGDVCIAYCYPGQIEAPDPYDCHKYYLCPKEGLVEEQNHFDCPAGSNFVVTESSCLEDAPCNTLCGVNTTTSSTTTTPFTTSYTTSTSHRIVIQPP